MLRAKFPRRAALGLFLLICAIFAGGQPQSLRAPIIHPSDKDPSLGTPVAVTVVDENGSTVAGAQVTISEPGMEPVRLWTDYAGICTFALRQQNPYRIDAKKPGFYETYESAVDASQRSVKVVLAHEQIVREQVNVTAAVPGIDTQQVSDKSTMNTPEIVNIPYETSRDIRNLLPFNPGVVQDATEQVHVAGSETWETLDTLDGFDIRSPTGGGLNMRLSTDVVRTIDAETTRYPVEFGRATGGVIAFYTGMGDNKFRFNATNFIPSYRDLNGIRFDQFVPRFTFSGPLKRNLAWWYDGVEMEYDNIYISELPAGADTDPLVRGSNLVKAQANLSSREILTAGLLFNDYHSPYEGISPLTPQQSTTKRNIVAWLPYLRNQWSLAGGGLLDLGIGYIRIRDGHEPYGSTPYEITPEQAEGSYFERLTGRSQRLEGTATLYLPPRHWAGRHDLRAGLDLEHTAYNQDQSRAPVSYLREGAAPGEIGTLERHSVFAQAAPFTLHNAEIGAYFEDRWQPAKGWTKGLLVEPGLRFDWDEIVRRALVSPRVAAVYSPPGSRDNTKISAGIGLYYEHTYLEDLAQTFAGMRTDDYYSADGTLTSSSQSEFTAKQSALREPRALNWSVSVEQKLPWSIIAGANFLEKRTTNVLTFADEGAAGPFTDDYLLTNAREDRYSSEEIDARRIFSNGYTVYIAYTHSSARTNAALNYLPTPSPLGTQQSGPLAWDTPNRVISWGWLPIPIWKLKNRWDFVYVMDWHTGFPYTAVNAADQVVGLAGAQRFPYFVDFSPGLEWKFHFRGQYWGLRGVMENATDSANPAVVNNDVDSPQFGTFSEPQGRSFTARIRLIGAK